MDLAALEQQLNSWAEGYLAAGRLPCIAVALTRGSGEILLRKEYGSSSQPLTAGLSPEEEASYMMMSCTKVVTAAAALQLLEQGMWALEDPVEKYLPAFANIPGVIRADEKGVFSPDGQTDLDPVRRKITMRMLLTHTSGLSADFMPTLTDGRPNPVALAYSTVQACPTLAAQVDVIAGLPLVAQPDTTWNYSMGVDVMGRCIEVLSGMPIDEYFDKFIFQPLGMHSTCFFQRMPKELAARRVACYSGDVEALIKEGANFYAPNFAGPKMQPTEDLLMGLALQPGGGLVSTLSDWLLFTQALLGSGVGANGAQILTPDSVALMAVREHTEFGCDILASVHLYFSLYVCCCTRSSC